MHLNPSDTHSASEDPYQRLGPRHLGEICLHVDKATSHNKNHVPLPYIGSTVDGGEVGVTQVNFMPVGHTHVPIDDVLFRCVPPSVLAAWNRFHNMSTAGGDCWACYNNVSYSW